VGITAEVIFTIRDGHAACTGAPQIAHKLFIKSPTILVDKLFI